MNTFERCVRLSALRTMRRDGAAHRRHQSQMNLKSASKAIRAIAISLRLASFGSEGVHMTRTTITHVLSLVATLIIAGCMSEPRNGLELSHPAAIFGFNGYVVNPSEVVELRVKNQSKNKWETRTRATSNTAPTNDGTMAWFDFQTTSVLGYDSSYNNYKYWRMADSVGSQRRIAADFIGRSPTQGEMTTFDVDANACIQANATGLAIASNCRSPNSPVATVYAKCGKPTQPCCYAAFVSPGGWCDRGRNCDTSASTCSIPSGDLNQPCNDDGTCNPGLFCGDRQNGTKTCRSQIEGAPIFSAELVVHTCDQSDAPTNAPIVLSLNPWAGNDGMMMLDHPGPDVARNRDDTWGVVIPKVKRLADIDEMSISLSGTWQQQSDGWCVDRVDLVVNGIRVFRKSYSTRQWLDSDTNSTRLFVASYDELRTAFRSLNPAPLCALPTRMTMTQIRRSVEGIMGDLFAKSQLESDTVLPGSTHFDASWGTNGSVTVTRLNANTVGIGLRFRAKEEVIDDFEGDATAQIELGIGCDWNLIQGRGSSQGGFVIEQCANDFWTDFRLKSVNFAADSLLDELGGLISAFGTLSLRSALLESMHGISTYDGLFRQAESMVCPLTTPTMAICDTETGDTDGDICGCPNVNVDSTGISFNWSDWGYQHLDLNVLSSTFLPNPICR